MTTLLTICQKMWLCTLLWCDADMVSSRGLQRNVS